MLRSELAEKAEKAIAAGHTSIILHVRRKRGPKEDCALVPGLRARCIGYQPVRQLATLAVNAAALKDWCAKSQAKGIWTFRVSTPHPTDNQK